MSPAAFLDHVRNGRNISVTKTAAGQRQLVLHGARGASTRVSLSPENYAWLMESIAKELAQRHGTDLTVDVKLDFYGSQWVEVRSGLISRRTSRLGLSPRYIALLQDLIAERVATPAEPA